jgi:hypothetical protein
MAGTRDRLAVGESLEEMVAGSRGWVSREAILEAIQIVTAGFLLLSVKPGLEDTCG